MSGSHSRPQPLFAQRSASGGPLRTRELPPDLIADAARRLTIAALAIVLLGAVAIPMMLYVEGTGIRPPRPFGILIASSGVLLSLVVTCLARWGRLAPKRLILLGLGYEVLLCGVVSLWEQFGKFPEGEYREMSFVCVLVVLFPALIPATPRRTLVTALLAAATGPLAYAAALAYGYHPRSAGDVGIALAYSLASAGLSVAPSLVITRLVGKVAAAREMGAYKLETLLGTGGMGEVWRASHRLLAQPAAVKLIRGEWLTDGPAGAVALERFKREARVTSQLRSQHTIDLYDFGLTEDGTFFYAMELLDGLDLETLVERHGPLPPARAVHLLRQACLSLEEAHRHGLVHRDVKPANLFVCHEGLEADHLKVLDFGLVAEERDAEATRLTAANTIAGTPSCMAPEQIQGAGIGPATDLYALGCVAYWLLAGHHVFDRDNAAMVLVDHLHTEPVPLREAVGPHIPEDLDEIVMECLEKHAEDRPESALALRARLSACACANAWTEEDASGWWLSAGRPGAPGAPPSPSASSPSAAPPR